MHHDLRELYWWNYMKKAIAEFDVNCPNCQHVKVEHQRPGGLAQNIELSKWKWEMINMDFIKGLIGPNLVHQAKEKEKVIQERLKMEYSRQKSYYDVRRRRIDNVAYELEQPQELAVVHPVFHISMLKKCIINPSLIIPTENIGIKYGLSYEEIPVQILDRQVAKLRKKDITSVKVLWRNQFV
ncbi:uncharacterized protein [Solanum lycopersicum]|uniref:uncharacterized protein n=1 Tax=Solanum lycopersicum TaxID=4081 RepID=UPI00374A6A1E